MAKDTTPLEEFRRVTATTMRAVSRKEVNVSFVPDGGSLLGSEARITVPARDLPVEDVSRVRGEADSMALKLRHHDRKTHLRRVPRGDRDGRPDPGQRARRLESDAAVPARDDHVLAGQVDADDGIRAARARSAQVADPVALHLFPGGHFYLQDHYTSVIAAILKILTPWIQ